MRRQVSPLPLQPCTNRPVRLNVIPGGIVILAVEIDRLADFGRNTAPEPPHRSRQGTVKIRAVGSDRVARQEFLNDFESILRYSIRETREETCRKRLS